MFKYFLIIIVLFQVAVYGNDKNTLLMNNVSFYGRNKISSKLLKQNMLQKENSILKRSYYDYRFVSIDSTFVLYTYRNNGFLDATVDSVVVKNNNGGVSEIFYITENERYLIDSISISGNSFFSTKSLLGNLKIKVGDYFDSKVIDESKLAIAKRYTNNGFLNAVLKTDYVKHSGNSINVNFTVKEKTRLKVESIIVEGNIKTKSNIIISAFPIAIGEWIYFDKLMHGQKRLYETGIFSSVSINIEDSDLDSCSKNIVVSVREKKAGVLEFGGGYGTKDGWRASTGVGISNIGGNASSVALRIKSSQLETKIGANYNSSWMMNTQFDGNVSTELAFRGDTVVWKIETGIGKPIGEYSNMNIAYRLEFGNLDNLKDKVYNGAILPGYKYDTRDDVFIPRKGKLVRFEFEYASPLTYSEYGYVKNIFEINSFYSISFKNTIALKLKIGTLHRITVVPNWALFKEGGDLSVRGYEVESIPEVGLGSLGEILFNAEFRRRFYKKIGLVFFVDNALMSSKEKYYEYHGDYLGGGLGLRYIFSLGVIRLDWAHKIRKFSDKDKYGKVYFAFGHSF